jgi:hypothetical protein
VARPLSAGEREEIPAIVERYVRLKERYRATLGDGTAGSHSEVPR